MMKRFFLLTVLSITTLFHTSVQNCIQCSADQPTISASHQNVWRPLSSEEFSSVSAVLTQKLNLTTSKTLSATDNRIFAINLLQPNKTNVLHFLDGKAGAPKRYARATVFFGSSDEAFRQEYIIGPLPATNATLAEPLTYPFNNGKLGKSKTPSFYAIPSAVEWAQALSAEIADITRTLWNTTIEEGGIGPRFGSVFYEEDGTQTAWATLLGLPTSVFNSPTILPLGVFFHMDMTSRRWEEWRITGWYSRGVFYNSTEAFREAVLSPGFDKPPPNVDGPWTSTDKQGNPLPLDDLPPPITVSEGKKRFKLDVQENFVSWMDFTFYMSTTVDQGLSLFDIRYKNKRIVYELALQEALAHYAGSDPQQSETLYFDSQGGMGGAMVSLVKGYDCPSHATYLNASYTGAEGPQTVPDSICLFEADANYPIRRHFATQENYTSVARNIVFTVRWIATVGNYDYLFDYNFFYDGSIEVSVRASGYISGAYYDGNDDYGFRIHDFLSGSLHDHVMTFKADLDMLGRENSVQKVEIVPATVAYPWSEGRTRNTMKLEKSFITSEEDSSVKWSPNDAAIYAIVNKDTPNKYGEYPGYRVKRSAGASHLTVKDSSNAGKAIHYATADLFVTKQKDTEPKAADWSNGLNINDPLVDFSKFLDGESLEQEDLVLWFNLGMHHAPHTGDLPNTLMTSAHSAIRLEPINYLMNDPSVQTNQQVRINHTSDDVLTFGAQAANCSIDLGTLNPLLL